MNSKEKFKAGIDKAFGSLGNQAGDIDIMMNAANIKSNLKEKKNQKLKGGKADKLDLPKIAKKHKVSLELLKKQLTKGIKVEMEHTEDKSKASEIAMDHLSEDPKYYQKLKKIETKEQLVVKPVSKKFKEKFLGREEKVTAKQQFSKDLQDDPDFKQHKEKSKFIERPGLERTFGVVNVSTEDPYIKKKTKYGRPGRGKEENNETTGTGSSGSYSAPLFGGDNQFIKKSDSETPKKVEANEVTSTASSGQYSTPAMWAPSTNKKDWMAVNKTQIPGGKFVQVKGKCKKFPYCNQGDIKALKIWENESIKNAIKSVSQKTGLTENVIKSIIQHEIEKSNLKIV